MTQYTHRNLSWPERIAARARSARLVARRALDLSEAGMDPRSAFRQAREEHNEMVRRLGSPAAPNPACRP